MSRLQHKSLNRIFFFHCQMFFLQCTYSKFQKVWAIHQGLVHTAEIHAGFGAESMCIPLDLMGICAIAC